MINKLTKIWLNKLQKNESLNIKDLYQFSKIKLKRKRIRKKFEKNYERYVSKEIKETFWGCLFAHPLVGSLKKSMELELPNVEPMSIDLPKCVLVYPEFKYQEENGKY